MKEFKIDCSKINEVRANLGVGVCEARRILWREQMLEYVSSAQSIDELRGALLEVIKEIT